MTSKQLNRAIEIQNRINAIDKHLAPSYKNDLKHINVFVGQVDNSDKFTTDKILSIADRRFLENKFNTMYKELLYTEKANLLKEFKSL